LFINYTQGLQPTTAIVVYMKFKADIKDEIVLLKIGSVSTPEELNEFMIFIKETWNTVHDLYDKLQKKVPILVDVTELKEYKPEAFTLLAGLLKHDELYTSKIAVFGLSMLVAAGNDALKAYADVKTPMEVFKTEEEALLFLRE